MKSFALFSLLVLLGTANLFAQTAVFPPVSPQELQLAKPVVEDGADAEVIYWEVRLIDTYERRIGWRTTRDTYLKIKIFNERGRERFSRFDLPFGNTGDAKVTIKDIAARTTTADGNSVELKPSDVFERDIVRASGGKIKAKSFVVPAVGPGAIVEFRWREASDNTFNYSRIDLARDIPVQTVKYIVKPANAEIGMRLHSHNVTSGFVEGPSGFYSLTMRNVPAFDSEPRMPSEYDVKPWVLMYYDSDDEKADVASYWRDRGKLTFETHKALLKPSGDVKTVTTQAVGDATDPNEKLRRIFDYVRTRIKNADDDALGLTSDQRQAIKENRSAADTIKHGIGTWHDILVLFGAMANAAGFDARFANVSSRLDATFNKNVANDHFVRREIVAVNVGGSWQFFDPSDANRPFGMVVWSIEGQQALVSDASVPTWVKLPVSTAESSLIKRTGNFDIAEDGTIEGDVRLELTGHIGSYYRESNDEESVIERDKFLTALVKLQAGSTAEVTNIVIENQSNANLPYIYSFHLKVPSYAEKTGRRLFLVPAVFKRSSGPIFKSAKRKYDIAFDYAWSEEDAFTFQFPNGFSAETLDAPKIFREERTGTVNEVTITAAADGKSFSYGRKFKFGKPGELNFYQSAYNGIKNLFDTVNKADTHVVVIRGDAAKND